LIPRRSLMQFKNFYLGPIRVYRYFSKMLPASCRYYPTCSEYALWQFDRNMPHKAFFLTCKRIIKCNQLFKGGIDYPLITFMPKKIPYIYAFKKEYGKIDIYYWFIPKNMKPDNRHYYVIKDFNAIKRSS